MCVDMFERQTETERARGRETDTERGERAHA